MSVVRLVGFIVRAWLGGVWAGWLWNAWHDGEWSTFWLVGACWLVLAAWVFVDVIGYWHGRRDAPSNPPTAGDGSSPCPR